MISEVDPKIFIQYVYDVRGLVTEMKVEFIFNTFNLFHLSLPNVLLLFIDIAKSTTFNTFLFCMYLNDTCQFFLCLVDLSWDMLHAFFYNKRMV